MNIKYIDGGVTAPVGFTAAGVHCGIRKNKSKSDLALILADRRCSAAAVYTQNLVKGSPIIVTGQNIADGYAQAVICNSGNANTCNADGEEKAMKMCEVAAEVCGIPSQDVIVASTGVIGQILPIEPIIHAKALLKESLSATGSSDAAEAIMTTDTFKKEFALEFTLQGKTVKMGGIAKGSGMIHPNMATMLCFITTDAAISPAMLQKALSAVIEDTFNMVSVDGDTSTNDMVSVLASGGAGNDLIDRVNEDYAVFKQALYSMNESLSREIARDGEGATKLLTCKVTGGVDKKNARIIAKSVITSSLFKAAMFGGDANWGRVLCAIGYSGASLSIDTVRLRFASASGEILVCERGAGVDFSEEIAAEILKEKEIEILIDLEDGNENATAFGCDLTYDYVKINGDYRT